MANIVEQRVDSDGIYVKVGDGRDVTITTQNILDHYNTEPGTVPEKRLKTREWIKDRITQICGTENIGYQEIDVDFNEATGEPTNLTVGGLLDD